MANQDPKRVVTGKVRLSFVHLFTPYARPGQEAKFSVTVLIPKSDVATKQRIDAVVQAAIQEGVSDRWNGVRPPQIGIPIYDGDGVKPSDGLAFGPECKGHWVLTASSKADRRPDIVDINLNPILDQTQVYSGCYGRVSLRFFAYFTAGKKGIGCGLGNVQKLEDGEPLGGGHTSAAEDFASLGATAPAPYTPQQPSYAPQAPSYTPQQPVYAPQAPSYAPQTTQIDPITGQPLNGGIMGL